MTWYLKSQETEGLWSENQKSEEGEHPGLNVEERGVSWRRGTRAVLCCAPLHASGEEATFLSITTGGSSLLTPQKQVSTAVHAIERANSPRLTRLTQSCDWSHKAIHGRSDCPSSIHTRLIHERIDESVLTRGIEI